MSISVQHEDTAALASWGLGLDRVMERCVFCSTGTRYWHRASNTPVCQGCAETHTECELPVKAPVECAET